MKILNVLIGNASQLREIKGEKGLKRGRMGGKAVWSGRGGQSNLHLGGYRTHAVLKF